MPEAVNTNDRQVNMSEFLPDQQGIRQAAHVCAWSLAICLAYAGIAYGLAPEFAPGPLDFVASATGLACVWLIRKQNLLNYPLGIISVISFGLYFAEINLMGQAWLQLAYYLPIQFYGWYAWVRGGENRSALKVSRLGTLGRALAVAAVIVGTSLAETFLQSFHQDAILVRWDASIVAASVVAQSLLSHKKVENWLLWILPVNVSGIALYTVSGAYMVAALYVIFLVNAVLGAREWLAELKLRTARGDDRSPAAACETAAAVSSGATR